MNLTTQFSNERFVILTETRAYSVTLARGCRAKGPGLRDSSRAKHIRRAGMTNCADPKPPAISNSELDAHFDVSPVFLHRKQRRRVLLGKSVGQRCQEILFDDIC